jgi:uncharacterized protein
VNIDVGGTTIPALVHTPPGATWLYVLAHGAGAGMRHRFMEAVTEHLADRGVATLRYEYPYMSEGRKRPDHASRLEAVTRSVVAWAGEAFPDLRLAAGGKSMGGRMTSRAQADTPLPRVERIVFLGFPLHPPGRPDTSRAEHLRSITTPMLFLQGTRDTLADLALMRGVCAGLGGVATLRIIEHADHGFGVLKRSGRTDAEVLAELADTIRFWLDAPHAIEPATWPATARADTAPENGILHARKKLDAEP